MNARTSLVRPLPSGLLLLAAFVAAVLALASPGSPALAAHRHPAAVDAPLHTAKADAFRAAMRQLWEDHIVWTRMVIVSFEDGSPDLDAGLARLLQNQADIGNAIKPFYGRAAGDRLTSLLRSHILIAADVLGAAKAGDSAKLADSQARWTANANQIAAFLNHANPHAWPLADLRRMMRTHLELTTKEAVAHLTGDWSGDVAAYDAVHREILQMSDMLANGIVAQFPRRFR